MAREGLWKRSFGNLLPGELDAENGWALVLVFLVIVWRLYLAGHLGLGDDEAYYWDWQNHLSLGYLNHPPLVAWLIWPFQHMMARSEFSVRLPFILTTLLAGHLFYLISEKFGAVNARWNGLIFIALVPVFSFGSFMAFPEVPMLAAWLWALWLALELKDRPRRKSLWMQLGLAVGLALMSQLTAVLLAVSMALWILSWPELRRQLKTSRPYLAFAVFLIVTWPELTWNLHHGFATVHFQWAKMQAHPHFHLTRWLEFLGIQILLFSPLFFWRGFRHFFRSFKHWQAVPSRWLLIFAGPPLLVFFLQPFFADFRLHWAAPAYLPLLVIALSAHRPNWAERLNWIYLGFINLAFLFVCAYPVLPVLNARLHIFEPWKPSYDFSNDFYGWRDAGPWVDQILARTTMTTGQTPYLLTSRYQLAGNLSYYSGVNTSVIGPHAEAYRYFENSPEKRNLENHRILFISDNRYTQGPEDVGHFKNCHSIDSLRVFRKGHFARSFRAWECDGLMVNDSATP